MGATIAEVLKQQSTRQTEIAANTAQATRMTFSAAKPSGNAKLEEAKAIICKKTSSKEKLQDADVLLANVVKGQLKLSPEKRKDLAAALNMRGLIATRTGHEVDGRLLMQHANDAHKSLTGSNMERAQYNIASSLAREGKFDDAKLYLAEAFRLKPELRENALKDPDFAPMPVLPRTPGLFTPKK